MSAEDYLISGLLLMSIIRQVRGKPLTWVSLTWPLALVTYAAVVYAPGLPTDPPSRLLASTLTVLGVALGLLSGALSQTWATDTATMTRATGPAAFVWILGIGLRLAFGACLQFGNSATFIEWSNHLGVTDFRAWSAGLLGMSLAEVLGRSTLLAARKITSSHGT